MERFTNVGHMDDISPMAYKYNFVMINHRETRHVHVTCQIIFARYILHGVYSIIIIVGSSYYTVYMYM